MTDPKQQALGTRAVSFSDWGCHEFRRLLGVPHLVVGSIIADSEFGDSELGPLGMRHMLQNATFFGFFENLGNQVFDASS